METISADVKDLIFKLVNDAMWERDRCVSIEFTESGPLVMIYPLEAIEDEAD